MMTTPVQFYAIAITVFGPIYYCDAIEKLTNIGYMGLGYDAYLGNPHTNLYDPGFRQAVFKLSYTDNTVSSDGKWLVPNNIQVLQTLSCSYSTATNVITGMTSYQKGLSVDATVEGSGFGAKFSASTSYQQVQSGTSEYHNIYVSSVAKCFQYLASSTTTSSVSDDFAAAVHALPSVAENGQSAYMNFIAAFGTHFVNKVVMGAKAVIQSEFSETGWSRLQQSNINIDVAASASFDGITGSASAGSAQQQSQGNQFNSQRLSYTAAYLGSEPSTDGRWETWAHSSGLSPYPIQYTLLPLTELFDVQYLSNMSTAELTIKRQLLAEAYKAYCSGLQNCGLPTPDIVPVEMNLVDSVIRGSEDISCNPGYSLLSCGLNNIPNTQPELWRHSYPINPTTCNCYDYFGAQCMVWCSNAVQGFEIQTSGKQSGAITTAMCSAGKKVLGCQMKEGNGGPERWRQYYPNNDGTGCTCYDYFGAECIATCASNIYDHEVKKQFGHGVVTVSCSENNYVFGCGINPRGDTQAEDWRTMYVSSMNSCTCYDYFGTICYAICGKFK